MSPPISTNDHWTVGVVLNFKVNKEAAYIRTVWQYKNADFAKFRNALAQADFKSCFNTNNIDDASEKWAEIFLTIAKRIKPNKAVTMRPNYSPWYTNGLRIMKRRMLRMFHKYKHSKLPTDWDKYTKLRNDYQKRII